MDHIGRNLLTVHKTNIKDNLYLSDRILDILEQTDTVDEEIAQKVKAEKTNEEKIDKLLYYLKRRGHKAFGNFIDAIRSDPVNETLAEQLQTEYDKASDNHKTKPDGKEAHTNHNQSQSTSDSVSTPTTVPRHVNGVRSVLMDTHDSYNSQTDLEPVRELKVQQNLSILYTQLKAHMSSLNMRELSFRSPKPISFQMVIELQKDYMKNVDECYEILGVRDKTRSLRSYIVDLKASHKRLKDEKKETELLRNKLSHQYIKLENKHREISNKVKSLEKENGTLTKNNNEQKDSLQISESKLKDAAEEIEKLKDQLRLSEEHNKEVGRNRNEQQHQHPNFCTNDEVAHSPRAAHRMPHHSPRRRRSVATSYNNRNFTSPRRNYNQQMSEDNGTSFGNRSNESFENAERANPNVMFDRNRNITAGTSSKSTLAGLVIGNSAVNKDPKVVPETHSVANESQRNARRRQTHGHRSRNNNPVS